jgi:RES domain-containing protein
MMSLPWERAETLAWRLDTAAHARSWDSGEGARIAGGRWNPSGFAAVYSSLDPATAILEIAVHKGFATIGRVPHTLTWCRISTPEKLFIVAASDFPNPNWLYNGPPSAAQQQFGLDLLTQHGAFAVPSVVSHHSWNLVFSPQAFRPRYELIRQEPFALDTRLNPV